MTVYRITASTDNTVTNAYGENLTTRGTGSNMGASDILEVFSIYGQASSTSTEYARALVQFPLDTISTKRTAGTLPASGSVDWYLILWVSFLYVLRMHFFVCFLVSVYSLLCVFFSLSIFFMYIFVRGRCSCWK